MTNSNFVTITEFSHSVTPPVVAFVGEHQGRKIVMGSGTIIAPHLALTCLHIFDEGFAKEFLGERLIDLEGYFRIPKNIPFALYAILGDNNDPLAQWFNVDLVSLSPFSDLEAVFTTTLG